MADPALIVPMAGRGSRFAARGIDAPKPLIELHGRPFFWWATESVARATPLREIVFVVLAEHVAVHAIDLRIAQYYPRARIVAIPDVTEGAAATARIGVEALGSPGPILVNDCDHAFDGADLAPGAEAGALLCFDSSDPAYSYARVEGGRVAGTVEKRAVSRHAIAGCYAFAETATFLAAYDRYRRDCPYAELFVSGLYNGLIEGGGAVAMRHAARHRSFGTPDEYDSAAADFPFLGWRG